MSPRTDTQSVARNTPADQMTNIHGKPTDELMCLDQASQGVIPHSIESCTLLMRACERVEQVAANVRWMTIARAKQLCVSPTEWLSWVMAEYPEYGSKAHVHHMQAVGDFLLHHSKSVARNTLFSLGFNKLIAVQRLPENLVEPFCAKEKPDERNRDQVRAAVNRWLIKAGIEVAPETQTGTKTGSGLLAKTTQPDFLDVLFKIDEKEDSHQFAVKLADRSLDVDEDNAIAVAGRSLQVVDALLPKVVNPARLAALARGLRHEADRADTLARGESLDD